MSIRLSLSTLCFALIDCNSQNTVDCGNELSEENLRSYLIDKYPTNKDELLSATVQELKSCPNDKFLVNLEFYIYAELNDFSALESVVNRLGGNQNLRLDQVELFGFAALDQKKFDLAADCLSRARSAQPDSYMVSFAYAEALFGSGRLIDALSVANALVGKINNYEDDGSKDNDAKYISKYELYILVANIYYEMKDYKNSFFWAKMAVKEDPMYYDGHGILIYSASKIKLEGDNDIALAYCSSRYLEGASELPEEIINAIEYTKKLYPNLDSKYITEAPSFVNCLDHMKVK